MLIHSPLLTRHVFTSGYFLPPRLLAIDFLPLFSPIHVMVSVAPGEHVTSNTVHSFVVPNSRGIGNNRFPRTSWKVAYISNIVCTDFFRILYKIMHQLRKEKHSIVITLSDYNVPIYSTYQTFGAASSNVYYLISVVCGKGLNS